MAEMRLPVRVLDSTDVWLHGAGALGILVSLASAPLLHAPAMAERLGLGLGVASAVHALGALAASGAWALHVARVCLAWLSGGSPWALAPRPADLAELGAALAWGAGLRAAAPTWGRYTYRERWPYAAFVLAVPILCVTGWLISHPAAAVAATGAAGLVAVADTHLAAGALLVPFLLWHLFFAHFQPGVLFWNSAWLTGTVPWSRVEATRPGWAMEILAAEAAPEPEPEPPPVSVEALLAEGNLAARQGRYDDAEEVYLRALEFYPGYSQALFNLGVARWKRGDKIGAADVLSRFLEQDPFNPVAPKAREILDQMEDRGADG